jgi:hypothetical protein
MRSGILVAALALVAVAAAAKTKPSAKIAALPQGRLTGQVYINDALGISYEYPSDWDADTDPKQTINLDPDHPDGSTVQCSRVLLSLEAPSQRKGKFSGMAALIAIDARCMTIVPFPQSVLDKQNINDVIDVIIKHFKSSPFLSPHVKIVTTESQGRVIIEFNGGMIVNAIGSQPGQPAPAKVPLEVHTSFFVFESRGFWIVRAYVADDSSEQELKQSKLAIADIPMP